MQEEERRGGKKGRLLGIITLSDVLRYLVGNVYIGGEMPAESTTPIPDPPQVPAPASAPEAAPAAAPPQSDASAAPTEAAPSGPAPPEDPAEPERPPEESAADGQT